MASDIYRTGIHNHGLLWDFDMLFRFLGFMPVLDIAYAFDVSIEFVNLCVVVVMKQYLVVFITAFTHHCRAYLA